MPNYYIGLVGPPGAGKSTVAKMMVEETERRGRKAVIVSMSHLIRTELKNIGIGDPTREQLTAHSQEQRRRFGVEYWMKMLVGQADAQFNDTVVIIDGLRNPKGDCGYLMRFHPASIVSVEADELVRVQRMRERARDGDRTDEEFIAMSRADSVGSGECGFNIPACIGYADSHISGDLLIEDVQRQVAAILDKILPRLD